MIQRCICICIYANMHILCMYPDWSVNGMIATMCIPYIPMLFAPLEHLLTDSMTPMLDVKLDHRHCSSPKCPTICRLGQYVPVAILSCIVASFMNIAHWLCAFAFIFVLQLIWANLPLPQFFFFGSTSILMPVLCFDKHTYVMPHCNRAVLSSTTWLVGLPYYGLVTSLFPVSHWVTLFPRGWESIYSCKCKWQSFSL